MRTQTDVTVADLTQVLTEFARKRGIELVDIVSLAQDLKTWKRIAIEGVDGIVSVISVEGGKYQCEWDEFYYFETPLQCVMFALEQTGKYLGHAETEDDL